MLWVKEFAGDVTSIATAWQQNANECQSRMSKAPRICFEMASNCDDKNKRNNLLLVNTWG